MTTRRKVLKGFAAGAMSAAVCRPGAAADWPQRPVKILVPFAAGGNTDGIARLVAQSLSEKLGQAFFVENHVGAGGALAAQLTATAAPDGYTLMMAALPQIAILPALKKTSYDPVSSFTPIVNIASNPFCLVANPNFKPKTLQEFIAYVKARPGQLSYASGGTGSVSHLTMVLLCQRAGLDMVHVPYQGGGPAISDVIGNQIPVYFSNLSEALPYAGRELRPLALSGPKRAAKLPDVPTVAEVGYPGFRSETWNGLIGPAGMPLGVVELVAREVRHAIQDPAIVQRFAMYGVDPVGSTPADFQRTIGEDIQQWKLVIVKADLKL
jgi:tripartite-type tricarboxylate transporter receptor subunit TctC